MCGRSALSRPIKVEQADIGSSKMRLIGNHIKFRLVLGGGERLEGQTIMLRSLSATAPRSCGSVDKQGKRLKLAGASPR